MLRRDGYYVVIFQNGTKQTQGMLDAVTFQDDADLEPTNQQPLYISISMGRNRGTGSPTTQLEGICFIDLTNVLKFFIDVLSTSVEVYPDQVVPGQLHPR